MAGAKVSADNAVHYLEHLKSQLECRPVNYNRFLDVMKEFKAQTINTAETIERVVNLLSGYRVLLLGFNEFLPPGYEIQVLETEQGMLSTSFTGPSGVSQLSVEAKADNAMPFFWLVAPSRARYDDIPVQRTEN